MIQFKLSNYAIIVVFLALFIKSAQAQSPEGIEWQTDLRKAESLAKSKRLPLVVYVFREDEKGPLPYCRALEAGALSSRELKHYRQCAVFVRVNSLLDDEQGSVAKLLVRAKITHVPSVSVLECRDEAMSVQDPIIGEVPTMEFVRKLRSRIIETSLAIRSRGRPASSVAEFVQSVETFRSTYRELGNEFAVATQTRTDLLNKLRYEGEFQVDVLKAADNVRWEIQGRMVHCLMTLAELQLPEVQAFCKSEIEIHAELDDLSILLQDDLIALTSEGRLPGTFAVTMARIQVSHSERQLEQEIARLTVQCENAVKRFDERYDSILGNRSVQFVK